MIMSQGLGLRALLFFFLYSWHISTVERHTLLPPYTFCQATTTNHPYNPKALLAVVTQNVWLVVKCAGKFLIGPIQPSLT